MPDLLVVVYNVAKVVAAAVVSFAHAHAVVGEVDVAVVAEEFGHLGGVLSAILRSYYGEAALIEPVLSIRHRNRIGSSVLAITIWVS